MAMTDTIVCCKCGKPWARRKALGINGAWLCGECLKDQQGLDEFLDAQLKPIGRVVRRAVMPAGD